MLTYQHRMFVKFYLGDCRNVPPRPLTAPGFLMQKIRGPLLLKRREVQAAIATGGDTACITDDEVVARLCDIACHDPLDFYDVDKTGKARVNLARIPTAEDGYLIKHVRTRGDGSVDIELNRGCRRWSSLANTTSCGRARDTSRSSPWSTWPRT